MAKHQKIGLGTVQFGTDYGISNEQGQTPPAEVSKILQTARKHRVLILDTASAYGNAEKVLGNYDLSDFRIVSKFMPPQKRKSVTVQFEQSIHDLKVTSLFGYLAHRPLHLAQNPQLWNVLEKLKKTGKVQKIGFSLSSPDELELLINNGLKPDLIQAPFNFFDRRFEQHMKNLKKEGCEIHTRSAFLQGLFFRDTNQLPGFFDPVKPLIETLQNLTDNLPAVLLNFVLQQPFIDYVIVGVENSNQFLENLKNQSKSVTLPELETDIPDQILIPSNWPAKQ